MQQPALLGGPATRTAAFPAWPPVTDSAVKAVSDAVRAGVWGAADGALKVAFEERFAAYHDARYGIAVNNGTVSLQIALAALGVGSGDEVIVPAYTFLATATAVLEVNALPVFVDVDPATATIDPAAVEAVITDRTKVIVPVHLGGQPADLDRLMALAHRHGLKVLEDAAQAHGASWNGHRVGSIGAFGSFSFQASKNLTSGEGGILTTNDEALAELAWSMHHCGRSRSGRWYEHAILGGNHRMTELQAALLLDQLGTAEEQLARRERSAAILDRELAAVEGLIPMGRAAGTTHHAYHLYQLRYDAAGFGGVTKERFLEAMAAEGIPCSAGYGVPLDRQPVFAKHAFDVRATGYDPAYPPTKYGALDLPATEALCREAVWIPQNVLLGEDSDMADIVAAATKVRATAAQLA
ncbi:MAG TPA: DegT/DnrJ/EryC1/StrS family aminotransferase [Mycobacteriales bacterium]|nr:DegT/DnrJ/EryC1/StrS family aminotransferase [Mycobacteriales bacterium]